MLLATTPNSSPEHLPGQRDLVHHADSRQGGKKPKSSPLCMGNALFLPQSPYWCFATCIQVEWTPQGLKSLMPQRRTASPHQISCHTFTA